MAKGDRVNRIEALIERIDARATNLMDRIIADRTADGFIVPRFGLAILSGRANELNLALNGIKIMANRRVA